MRLNLSIYRHSPVASRSGVALIVTIIMISVITFLTVAFLALSGREKGAVKTATNQTTARLAADQALERAKVEMLAGVLERGNPADFGLLVSTNYINWNGFDTAAVEGSTNVNFDYLINGAALTGNDPLQNLGNLLYSPRVPVFITNRIGASNEFRYYIDLNRNARHDRSGFWPVTNSLGQIQRDANLNFVTNYVTGDPQWIGGLDRPQQLHSASNKFLYRYAYLVVPEGKTLDINYIHNAALAATSGNMDANGTDFFRNQGVGSWEINFAAFLHDLNTNQWGSYSYDPVNGVPTAGTSFSDAAALYRYKMNGNPGLFNYDPISFRDLYQNNNAEQLFRTDKMDGYADGSLLTTVFQNNELGAGADDVSLPWLGADLTNHFFTTQDLFDPNKVNRTGGGAKFTDRLYSASTNISTYDQYTFYRMLEQIGTDSAPEDPEKLNLNYVNVGGLTATNFIQWTDPVLRTGFTPRGGKAIPAFGSPALLFFTNAVDRLLKAYTEEWLASDFRTYTNIFRMDQAFGVTNIPVFVSNQFIYPPAVHRVLQVAANIWESKNATNLFPTVFRPVFTNDNGNVFIRGFVEETTQASILASTANSPIIDLYAVTNAAAVAGLVGDGNVLIYGVPLVIGAKKGLPNFNEFATESTFVLTRKLQLKKNGSGVVIQTNQFFTMQLTMPSAAEFWNSYASNYSRQVSVYVTNRTTMTLTNDLGVAFNNTFITGGQVTGPKAVPPYWPSAQTRTYQNYENPESFVVTMRTNIPFLPLIGYLPDRAGNAGFVSVTNTSLFDISQAFVTPKWGMTITNRVNAMILDQATGRIIDYVLLGNLVSHRNLTEEFSRPTALGAGQDLFNLLWATNTFQSGPLLGRLSGSKGIEAQIQISRGANGGVNLSSGRWRSFGNFSPPAAENESAKFIRFLSVANTTNLVGNVPFSPSISFSVPMLWQANDPLVHYQAGELFHIAESEKIKENYPPTLSMSTNALDNIGRKNTRYRPWGKEPADQQTDPDVFNVSIKDALVRSSDDWQFTTNALPTLGWLGRIHRGTPWQTVYLKSSDVGLTNVVRSPSAWAGGNNRVASKKWSEWTGNSSLQGSYYTRPVSDRLLFDVFTTAINDNSSRGRLSVNQAGLAAWSAVLSGMVALTNTSSQSALLTGLPPQFAPVIVQPAGLFDYYNTNAWPPIVRIHNAINTMRNNTNYFVNGTFNHVGDVLAVPELTIASPFLNLSSSFAPIRGMTDAAYEWLPQQILSLLQTGKPRFAIYSYGQALQPAPNSILAGGAFSGLCTNYAISAEQVTRTVVTVIGSSDPGATNSFLSADKRYPPRLKVESYNILGPD